MLCIFAVALELNEWYSKHRTDPIAWRCHLANLMTLSQSYFPSVLKVL